MSELLRCAQCATSTSSSWYVAPDGEGHLCIACHLVVVADMPTVEPPTVPVSIRSAGRLRDAESVGQVRPDHYSRGGIEAFDVIEAWELGFNLGNVVKYVARAGHKGDRHLDLRKALTYLQRELGQAATQGDGDGE